MTSASQIKRQWHHQTRQSRAKTVKDKEVQEITEATAAPGGSALVPVLPCLYRRCPVVPSRNFRNPACLGSTWTDSFLVQPCQPCQLKLPQARKRKQSKFEFYYRHKGLTYMLSNMLSGVLALMHIIYKTCKWALCSHVSKPSTNIVSMVRRTSKWIFPSGGAKRIG